MSTGRLMPSGSLVHSAGRELRRLARSLFRELRVLSRKLFRRPSVKLRGFTLEVDRSGWSRQLLMAFDHERYEGAEADCLESTLDADDRLLELGTGAGLLAMVASRTLGSASIRSYEANPDVVAMARRNHERNGLDLDIRNAVVLPHGDSREQVPFYSGDDFWHGSLLPTPEHTRERLVRGESLARVLEEFRPTYVAADIEGGEVALFRDSDLPGVQKLLIELHGNVTGAPARDALVRHFLDVGFEIGFEFCRREVVYFHRHTDGDTRGA